MNKDIFTDYWVVYDNLEFEKKNHFDSKITCMYWIFVFDTGRSHTTGFGNTYNILQYRFFDNTKTEFLYSSKNWTIQRIIDQEINHFMSNLDFHITDPKGKYRIIESRGNGIHCIEQAINLIENLSKYHSWEMFDIAQERDYYHRKIEAFKATKKFNSIEQKIKKVSDQNDAALLNQVLNKEYSYEFYNLWLAYNKRFDKSDYSTYFEDALD